MNEKTVATFDFNGISVDVVNWNETIWCGKVGYAENNTDEPNVGKIFDDFFALDTSVVNERIDGNFDGCVSINYLSKRRPNGVILGFLVGSENQPNGFDVLKFPAAQYMRVSLDDNTAKALGEKPWQGGIPLYQWITEKLAPKFGYQVGDDTLPIFEYYGYYNPEKNIHKLRYLYVPITK
jgi:Uncharacterized protein conserved in bacteria